MRSTLKVLYSMDCCCEVSLRLTTLIDSSKCFSGFRPKVCWKKMALKLLVICPALPVWVIPLQWLVCSVNDAIETRQEPE